VNILCVGGGPGGLFFSIAAALADPGHRITLVERRPDATTYGWGIAVSRAGDRRDDLLAGMQATDPETARVLRESCLRWSGQQVALGGARPVHLGGSGYCMSRQRLIDVLVGRARDLGVTVEFGAEVTDLARAATDYDLVVLADGAGSRLRRSWGERFGTAQREGRNVHVWLNCPMALADFTYAFEPTPAGWIWFYGYPYAAGASTVIVECGPETWAGLGLDVLDDTTTMAALSRLFARHLAGRPLQSRPDESGRSPWARFPMIANERWHAGNVALLGDCAHTAHFSIGSGTKLALQDAAALGRAVASCSPDVLPAVLRGYQDTRLPVVRALQQDATRSARWFENVDRTIHLDPVAFGYALRTRKEVPEPDGQERRRPCLDYGLHRVTQWRVGRAVRRTVAATRRGWRCVTTSASGRPRPSDRPCTRSIRARVRLRAVIRARTAAVMRIAVHGGLRRCPTRQGWAAIVPGGRRGRRF
jgi:anthraniloyl-CoA monooxygenase